MGCATRFDRRFPPAGCKSLGGNNNEQRSSVQCWLLPWLSAAACGSTATSEATSTVSSETSSTVASGESAASGSYTGTPIKVGGIGPITGAAATYGNAVKNAEELAVKEINAANGSDVFDWKFEDDEHDAEKSVSSTAPERLGHAGSGWPHSLPPDPGGWLSVNDNMFRSDPFCAPRTVIETGDNVFESASPTAASRVLHPLTTLPRTLWLPRSASSMTLLTLTLPAFTPSSRPKLRARALRSSLLKLSPATTRATCPPRLPSARKLALSWCSCPSTTPRLLRS